MTISSVLPAEIPLLDGWRFFPDPDNRGEELGWQSIHHATENWQEFKIPHTWNTMAEYDSYEGIAWYRLVFDCPTQAEKGCVRLKFDAIFYLARIWLNGEFLGEHEGGYTPFEFDVSSLVRPSGKNFLAVRVDNRRATNRLPAHLFEGRSYGWNNYGGIVREVRLILTSQVYLDTIRLVSLPHLIAVDQAERASISAHVSIKNNSNESFKGQVTLEVLEELSSRQVASTWLPVMVSAADNAVVSLETSILNPLLWHFDQPHLYICVMSLKDEAGIEYNRRKIIFGIREVGWQNGQFMLNGEPVRLAGLSRHADVPGYGLAETVSVMSADYDDLKNLNMVIARPVHYPQHEFIYDYCDRNGILLSPELPAWQLTAGQMDDEHIRSLAKQQLAEMIAAACNHPCIWAWSVGNELESDTVAGRAFVRDMVEYVRSLDSTRPVGFASYHLLVGRPWGDATKHADFVMMNQYFGTWHGPKGSLGTALDTIHLTWPEKMVIVSEFGFAPHWQRVEGPKIVDPEQYYQIPEDVSADSPEVDIQRQRVIHDHMAVFRSRAFVSAAVYWAYRGDMGVVDHAGHRRPSWQTLRDEFSPLLLEKVTLNDSGIDRYKVDLSLRSRGPLDRDMPAYTLRNYRLQWEVTRRDGRSSAAQGNLHLPDLSPGEVYDLVFEVTRPATGASLHLTVIRPTGFTVIERWFDLD
jgi:hypothetical protein